MALPSKMRAVGISKTGDSFEVIEELELPLPKLQSDEILVKVEYAGVNWLDTAVRKGTFPVPIPPLPQPLGAEAAGTIVALPTDQSVLSDEEYSIRGFRIGAKVALVSCGAFAEYMAVSWKYVVPLPDEVSTRDGAAAMIVGITALTIINEAYDVKAGDRVLVHTVAGGVGLCLAQLIAARGATVIGTTSTPEKAEIAKAHGAKHVILYKNEDFVQRVLELTEGKGVDAIFDSVGKDTFEGDLKVIKKRGTIVGFGATSGPMPPFQLLGFMQKCIKYTAAVASVYIEDPKESRKWFGELYRLVADGTLKMLIHKEYPFTASGVQQSQKDMVNGTSIGKLVIKIA
ncbi:NAD-P-binding protein [Lentinus tigrinus ALCF2SS1-6]|uniref:Probable quinone oxidoreductase n=1 Tax=Lentinus tigrinus ALCF2SS1-6 TaxID=1328759 RepID=A0A5C2SJ42_9APHY|nr:NAD-P-binding protein [Lentinus tigrinus ALCF2SS1-6]